MTEHNNQPSAAHCDLCQEISEKLLSDITPENFEFLRDLAKRRGKTPGQVIDALLRLTRDLFASLDSSSDSAAANRDGEEFEKDIIELIQRARSLANSLHVLMHSPSGNVMRARECWTEADHIRNAAELLQHRLFPGRQS